MPPRAPVSAAIALLGLSQSVGCIWLTEKADADGDGVPSVLDCAPSDPELSVTSLWYPDLDQDGYGDQDEPIESCAAPDRAVLQGGDCDDLAPGIHPDAEERCDGVDEDCDGEIDEDESLLLDWYADTDGDGYGDDDVKIRACAAPEGFVDIGGDCDDGDAARAPDREERCDGLDDDCSGVADDLDADGDGFGACDDDCDDGDGAVFPGAEDLCGDDLDAACDGAPCLGSLGDARVTLYGSSGANVGVSMAALDDQDGDGWADLAVGADVDSAGGVEAGAVYLLRGPLPTGQSPLDSLAVTRLLGTVSGGQGSRAGRSIAGNGDLDGDGYPDLGVGAHQLWVSRANQGGAYVVLGPLAAGDLLLDDGGAEQRWLGEKSNDRVGYSMELLDLDQDGDADLITGAYTADGGGADSGVVYVLYDPLDGDGDDGLDGVSDRVLGEAVDDTVASRVRRMGDLDADGFEDLGISCVQCDSVGNNSGSVYLITEPVSGSTLASDAASAILLGPDVDALLGSSMAPAGDLDGDGYGELWVGAMDYQDTVGVRGGLWLMDGPLAAGSTSVLSARLTLLGQSEDNLGWGLDAGRDLDGDGELDMAAGAKQNGEGGTDAGMTYVVTGPMDSGVYDIVDVAGRLTGVNVNAHAGRPVLLGGDLTGGGLNTLITGAEGGAVAGVDSGAVYLNFGFSP